MTRKTPPLPTDEPWHRTARRVDTEIRIDALLERVWKAWSPQEVSAWFTDSAAGELRVGDRVWFRHAKAGELCERFDVVHLMRGDAVVGAVPTYRGEGRAFL